MSPRRRAWLASLVLHAAVLVGFVASSPQPGTVGVGPVAVSSGRACEVGVVLIDETPPQAIATPVELPPVPAVPLSPPLPPVVETPTPVEPIRPAAYAEPPPLPRAASMPPVMPSAQRVPDAPRVPNGHPEGKVGPAPDDPAGPPGIAFCGVQAKGTSVVYVIDRSASMGLDSRFDRARRAVAASLRRLPPNTRFQVIAYHRTATALPNTSGLIAATPGAVEAAIAHLDSLAAEGSNGHRAALAFALSMRPDAVYYLTDDDELTVEDVREVTQLNRRAKASIHTLCLVPPRGDTPMRQLAANNRGVFQVVAP
ncbi:MAG: VWA domain-containing protein [Gemmataceae bacterium]